MPLGTVKPFRVPRVPVKMQSHLPEWGPLRLREMIQPTISGKGREGGPEDQEVMVHLPGTRPFSALGCTVSQEI